MKAWTRGGAAIGAIAALAAGSGRAEPTDYQRCMAKAEGVTSDMRDCAGTEYARLDRDLNAEYRLARSRLAPDAQQRLRLEERAWLKRRSAKCNALGARDGTAALLDADSCTLKMTATRITELKAIGPR